MYIIKETELNAHTYIITRFDRAMLIDPSASYEDIMRIVEARSIDGILITHAHSDHVHSIHLFNCPVYVSAHDAALLFMDEYNGYYPKKAPYKRKDLNIVIVENQMKIPFADQTIECISIPGHTKGSMGYLYMNQLYSGDVIFYDDVGRHDLYSGSPVQLKHSVETILKLSPQTKVYPGHGKQATVRDLKNTNPYVQKWFNKQRQK